MRMKFIISILVLMGLCQEPKQNSIEQDISIEAIEFLKDHDAYDDVIDAFYSDTIPG
jgi:hypothetical protein